MTTDQQPVPFGTFGPDLESLYLTVRNKLHLEWPKRLSSAGSRILLEGTVAVSHVTYQTIIHLCADNPGGDNRRPEYVIAATPLIRTILDAVCSMVLLFDDFERRKEQFFKGGWKEIREEYDRLNATYGSDPEWKEWLLSFREFVERGNTEFGITPEEYSNPKSIKYWPTPGQMSKAPELAEPTKAFLQYLYDWFYKELSSDSHLSLPGLARRSLPILDKDFASIDNYRSRCVLAAAALSLALLSEIQMQMKWPDLPSRFEYLWTILAEYSPDARALYDRRYRGNLAAA